MALTDEQIQAVAVATLSARGDSQEKIRQLLGISSQSKVSRLLKNSKQLVEFRVETTPVWKKKLSDGDLSRIEAATFVRRDEFENKIRELARARGQVVPESIKIVHASGARDSDEFGREAAKPTASLIERAHYCAVAWGTTLDSLISALGAQRKRSDLTFVPISGQPLNSHEPGSSPSGLARRLSEIFDIPRGDQLSLHGVPARIPKDMAEDAGTIKNFVEHCDEYLEIFGSRDSPDDGLMNKVDMILSGIGDPHSSKADAWYKDFIKMEGGELPDGTAQGNIGGIWLPMDSADDNQKDTVVEINDRSIG
ncbi:MAG: hypothetical protein KJO82_02300, partial [Gammaproteobacteria bacterium]|nr:hypothetical protein [Gammaproteobacteria bacterium]